MVFLNKSDADLRSMKTSHKSSKAVNLTGKRLIKLYLILLFLLFPLFVVHAQDPKSSDRLADIFIAPLAEVIGYSRKGPAYGGGLAIGAGDFGYAIGLRVLYAVDTESVHTLELNFFVRYYFLTPDDHQGPYFQINAGPAVFSYNEIVSIPSEVSEITASLVFGWRVPLSKSFFVEPAVRVGYPYIVGAGVSAGFRL